MLHRVAEEIARTRRSPASSGPATPRGARVALASRSSQPQDGYLQNAQLHFEQVEIQSRSSRICYNPRCESFTAQPRRPARTTMAASLRARVREHSAPAASEESGENLLGDAAPPPRLVLTPRDERSSRSCGSWEDERRHRHPEGFGSEDMRSVRICSDGNNLRSSAEYGAETWSYTSRGSGVLKWGDAKAQPSNPVQEESRFIRARMRSKIGSFNERMQPDDGERFSIQEQYDSMGSVEDWESGGLRRWSGVGIKSPG